MTRTGYILAAVMLAMLGVIFISAVRSHLPQPPPDLGLSPEIAAQERVKSAVLGWMQQHLKDDQSLRIVDWSDITTNSTGGSTVTLRYRAKNSFGAMVLEQQTFVLTANTIAVLPSAAAQIQR